ncbi:MAG TPA: hypothetical protein VEF04_14890, partial [Blastocatellia bacterium]|nr:hypothetical protein [Blastocatellia bacterium]
MNHASSTVTHWLILLLSLVLISSPGFAQGKRVKRLQFARGTTSAVEKGTIKSSQEIVYLVGAREGQLMKVSLTGRSANNDIVFTIEGPAGSDLVVGPDTNWNGKLPKTGDYKL